MAWKGFCALLCAGAALAAGPAGTVTPPADDREAALTTTLAVQTALQQGREHLLRHDFKSAIYVLEGQLAKINGNRIYLSVLQDAYRGHIKELRLARQDAAAQMYLDRLKILDPGSALDRTLNPAPAAQAAATPPAPAKPVAVQPTSAPAAAAPPAATVRAKSEDDSADPFHPSNVRPKPASRVQELLARADQEFASKRYREARQLYEQAHQEDRAAVEPCKERWAYCKLNHVIEQLNQPAGGSPGDLEAEVRLALSLAPRLEEQGQSILTELQRRRDRTAAGETPRVEIEVSVQHYERNGEGYYATESANFRIYHQQTRELAEQVARAAEATRWHMQRKWFGTGAPDWTPKCDIYLHATGQDYSRITGVPNSSPGHSSFRIEAGRVIGRRIDLHCDVPGMLTAVLPHEATHVVLAGQFGDMQIPRWADEGIAVLTEPRDKVERHLRNLDRCRQEQQLLGLRQLMQLADYPEPRHISAFYAQSVSLVEHLAREKGPQVFVEFLREGMRGGYEPALQRYYGYRTFEELEQRWTQQAFAPASLPNGVADRGR